MAWMRQKSESEQRAPEPTAPTKTPTQKTTQAPEPRRETRMERQLVNIGQSVQIKGELTGNEDLTIDGMVDGKIVVKDHNLTIGANGRINAEVHGKTVVVVGQIVGNITADDKVEIAPTGSVQGDIKAPRVAISDGARFRGAIDMDVAGQAKGQTQGVKAEAPTKPQGQPVASSAARAS